MARTRRPAPVAPADTAPGRPAAAAAIPLPAAPAASPLPAEPADDGWAAALLALMMLLAPALGVPSELMLQDTLKSIVVAGCALTAALLFFLQLRTRTEPLRWHGILWLPLLLAAYALVSMAWSHRYLAGVEAVRWFLFALIAWLALNTFTRERLRWLAWGVHLGALVAALWAVLQFWFAFDLFPQGPNPASTFINRNFFAEFVVCTLPFGALLLAQSRSAARIVALAASLGLVVTAILMTGTRAALIALWLQLLLVLPLVAWRCRAQLALAAAPARLRLLAVGVLVGTVLALGLLPSANPKIVEEARGATALARGLNRTQSIGPQDYSLGVRMVMWRATLTAIEARPLLGLGAGAWESEIPRYQAEGSQLETDYYVHNEFLQLVAEYGLVGWLFLLLLAAWLLQAGWRSWRAATPEARQDQPWRAVLLASLLALMVVSNIGFPWRMATTGALFALCLGGLAASDARLGPRARALAQPLRWSRGIADACSAATVACLLLAVFITKRAAEAERKLVEAAKVAISITATGRPNDPAFDPAKRRMLALVREGIAINPHYRKITPMVADELARWGDWRNATWVWDSVLSSRPYIVAILSNAARGHAQMGQTEQAFALLERARQLQPNAPPVRSLEVILLARSGQEAKALALAREAMNRGLVDRDLVQALFVLATRAHDYPLAERAARLKIEQWPDSAARSWVQLGLMYGLEQRDPARALNAFRQGLAAAGPAERTALLQQIPLGFREQLEPAAAPRPQTSASSP
ncbi:MAG TPA: O-antigen ligase family protein [Ramlibacter sp.]|nr:O-antigen ligase family protein [Ramlibacter sp.]